MQLIDLQLAVESNTLLARLCYSHTKLAWHVTDLQETTQEGGFLAHQCFERWNLLSTRERRHGYDPSEPRFLAMRTVISRVQHMAPPSSTCGYPLSHASCIRPYNHRMDWDHIVEMTRDVYGGTDYLARMLPEYNERMQAGTMMILVHVRRNDGGSGGGGLQAGDGTLEAGGDIGGEDAAAGCRSESAGRLGGALPTPSSPSVVPGRSLSDVYIGGEGSGALSGPVLSGIVCGDLRGSVVFVLGLRVDSRCRGQGVAKRLMVSHQRERGSGTKYTCHVHLT